VGLEDAEDATNCLSSKGVLTDGVHGELLPVEGKVPFHKDLFDAFFKLEQTATAELGLKSRDELQI
jgi:hypothetical protein